MNRILPTKPEIPRVVESMCSKFVSIMKKEIPEFEKEVNRDCKWSWDIKPDGSHVRRGSADLRNNPLSVYWEQFSGHHFLKTLESIGSNVRPKGSTEMSDRVYQFNYEGVPYIICGDGKVSTEQNEHVPDPQGLKIHIGVNQCPDDRVSIYKSQPQTGRQPIEKNGVNIFCLDMFLNYEFNEDFTYTLKYYGIAWIPSGNEFDIEGFGGKSTSEMRMRLKDPRLYSIHSFASESDPQTQDSTPSDNIEHQVVELPTP